jgi:spoIIIJ-associated protein
VEYVEVRGKTVEVALEAALAELGIERDQADVEVIQEPEKGFLGMGGKDAVIRVKAKPQQRRRGRGRRGGVGEGDDRGGSSAGASGNRRSDRGRGEQRPQGGRNGARDKSGGRDEPRGGGRGGRTGDSRQDGGSGRHAKPGDRGQNGDREKTAAKEGPEVSIDEQAPVVEAFLKGLVSAFGLEGTVTVTTDDDVIVADVSGPQTEAMVGPRGSTIEAIHELTKTVLQRQTQASARLRLDIAGYAERRRQALAIYADQLIDQVLNEGGEVMLEPMSAGDRKTIHDAVAKRDGVRSYSEGEAPQRFVVIAADEDRSEEE